MLKAGLLGKAVAYYRVSSDEQKKGETIKGQSSYVRSWCQSREITLAAEYRDEGDNGEGEFNEREGGAGLWAAAQRREFQTVVVFAVNRTGRTAYAALHMFHKLRKLGIRLISATEDFDPDEPTGRFLIAILAGKAESDKSTIRLHTETGKTTWQNVANTYTGGAVPFGYMKERQGKRQYYTVCDLRIPGGDCSPADVIRYIFRRCRERATCGTIADELNARSITTCWVPGDVRYDTPSRARWYAQRVNQILTNPFYKGLQMIGDPRKRSGVVRAAPTPHQVPALVSEEEWAQAQAQLKKNATMADRSATQFYLLRGKIVCRLCGRNYCGANHVGAYLPKGRYYRCNPNKRGPQCRSHWLDAETVEQQVKHDILLILEHHDGFVNEIRSRLGSQKDRIDRSLEEARKLEQAREDLQSVKREYLRMRGVGLIEDDAELGILMGEVREKEQTLTDQAEALRNEALRVGEVDQQLRGAQSILEAYHARIEVGITDEEWRRLVEFLLVRIEVETESILPEAPRRRGQRSRKQAEAHRYYQVNLCAVGEGTTSGDFINFTLNTQALMRLAA